MTPDPKGKVDDVAHLSVMWQKINFESLLEWIFENGPIGYSAYGLSGMNC